MTGTEWANLGATTGFIGLSALMSWCCWRGTLAPTVPLTTKRALVALGSLGPVFALASAVRLMTAPPFSWLDAQTATIINGCIIWIVFLAALIGVMRQRSA